MHGESCYASVLSCGRRTEGHTHNRKTASNPEELVCGRRKAKSITTLEGGYGRPGRVCLGQEESERTSRNSEWIAVPVERPCVRRNMPYGMMLMAAERRPRIPASKSTEAEKTRAKI